MARTKNSIFDFLIDRTARFPWWAGVFLAVASFAFFQWGGGIILPAGFGTEKISVAQGTGSLPLPAFFGQFFIPAMFLSAALVSAIVNLNRKGLYDRIARSDSHNPFHGVSRCGFLYLVGEYFRRRRFSIEKTRAVADNGMYLVARKGQEKYLIYGRYQPDGEAGVQVVEKLSEALIEAGVTGGIAVVSGEFAGEAIPFARGAKILLLDGRAMHKNMQSYEEVERNTGEKTGGGAILKWVPACLLAAILSLCLPNYEKPAGVVMANLRLVLERFLPGSEKIRGGGDGQVGRTGKETDNSERVFTKDDVAKAMKQVLSEKRPRQATVNSADFEAGNGKYLFEIELVTGSRLYTDNALVTAEAIVYQSADGIVTALNKDEVRTIKKTPVND